MSELERLRFAAKSVLPEHIEGVTTLVGIERWNRLREAIAAAEVAMLLPLAEKKRNDEAADLLRLRRTMSLEEQEDRAEGERYAREHRKKHGW